jgi:hypothetical protein
MAASAPRADFPQNFCVNLWWWKTLMRVEQLARRFQWLVNVAPDDFRE